MRTFELRQYTLRSKEALDIYMNQIYPGHLGRLSAIWYRAPRRLDRKGQRRAKGFRAGFLSRGRRPRRGYSAIHGEFGVCRRNQGLGSIQHRCRSIHNSYAFNEFSSQVRGSRFADRTLPHP